MRGRQPRSRQGCESQLGRSWPIHVRTSLRSGFASAPELITSGRRSENIHLQSYTSPADFWSRCYPRYTDLFARSARFLSETDASPERTLILVSAGFDACEHEGAGMQRHGGNVPVRPQHARSLDRIIDLARNVAGWILRAFPSRHGRLREQAREGSRRLRARGRLWRSGSGKRRHGVGRWTKYATTGPKAGPD